MLSVATLYGESRAGARYQPLLCIWVGRQMTAELICLAMAVYFEARSEPILGQAAVAQVVLNRVESDKYPSTICGVVTQGGTRRYRCQFSYYCDGKSEEPKDQVAWRRAKVIARLTYEGALHPDIHDATHYHAVYVKPYWKNSLQLTATIGHHRFYSDRS